MQLYLGAPQKALCDWVLSEVGNQQPCWVIVPAGVPALELPPGFEQTDVRGLLARHLSEPQVLEASPDHLVCLARVCEQVLDDTSYFGRVRQLPGFHRQLVQRFTEWHLEGLNPERLAEGANAVLADPPDILSEPDLQEEWRKKTDELVTLWRAWREALQAQNLFEPAQMWWQVIDILRRGEERVARPCVWLGFTRLRQAELTLLKVLDVYTSQHFALLCDPDRPDLFKPTLKLYDALRNPVQCEERRQIVLAAEPLDVLRALERGLWSPAPPTLSTSEPMPITLLDVPNPMMEMETVAREILKLSEAGYTYEEIAILLRQPASAIEMLEVVFERYGIPFTGEVSLPLTRSRAVAWLMQGLRLMARRERWHAWVDWFRHPLFGFTPLQLRRLETLRRVENLSDAINQYSQKYPDDGAPLQWLRFCQDQQARLRTEFYEVIRELALKMTPHDSPEAIESDDLKTLLQLAKAYQQEVRPLLPPQALAYLERLVARSSYTHRWSHGGVRLLNAEHADLVGAKVVFVMGVLEGVYPYRHPDEPFLREAERIALDERLQPAPSLPTRTELQAGEPLRFYRALTTAQERLYLSYPRTQNDSDALPSFYLKAVERALGQPIPTRTLTLDQIVPEPQECLHPYDRTLSEMAEPYIEPPDTLSDATVRQTIANLHREFSVSELESLVRCPFQHLMRYILRVRVPRRGLQITHVGTVLHQTLYHLLSRINDPDQWAEQLMQVLEQVLQDQLGDLSDWQRQVVQAYALRLVEIFIAREPGYRQQFGMRPSRMEWAFGNLNDLEDEERVVVSASPQSYVQSVAYPIAPNRQIALRGVIDRIDLSDDRSVLMIIDYKLSGAPSKKDFKEGRALQFLIYADVARLLLAQNNRTDRKIVIACDSLAKGTRTRYFVQDRALLPRLGMKQGEPSGVCQTFSHGEWQQMFHNLRNRLREALSGMEQAQVEPTPDQHCQMCPYGDVCRKSWVAGSR